VRTTPEFQPRVISFCKPRGEIDASLDYTRIRWVEVEKPRLYGCR
jgi:hypothetical protein